MVATCEIKRGEKISRDMLTFKRPGTGISPDEILNVVGKVALRDIEADTILKADMIEWNLVCGFSKFLAEDQPVSVLKLILKDGNSN